MKNLTFNNTQEQTHFSRIMREVYLHNLNQKKVISLEKLLKLTCFEFGVEETEEIQRDVSTWYQNIVDLNYLKRFEEQKLHEVIVHSIDNVQLISSQNKTQTTLELSIEDFQLSLETLCVMAHQEWSYNKPFTSFSYQLRGYDYRMTLVHASISQNGQSKCFVRHFHQELQTLDDLNLSLNLQSLLKKYVNEKKNILITGPTGSGKTTLLKGMLYESNPSEHLIVIEDYPELNLKRENTTQLIAEPENPKKDLHSFCSYAMRMRPDRIALGEMRGAEVTSFILSMNTGHKGMMATLHANSAIDTVMRIVTLFGLYSEREFLSSEQLVSLVCQNIDGVIYMEEREIKEVIELRGAERGVPYYESVFLKAA